MPEERSKPWCRDCSSPSPFLSCPQMHPLQHLGSPAGCSACRASRKHPPGAVRAAWPAVFPRCWPQGQEQPQGASWGPSWGRPEPPAPAEAEFGLHQLQAGSAGGDAVLSPCSLPREDSVGAALPAEGPMGMWCGWHLPRLGPGASPGAFLLWHRLAQAWLDEMDFAVPNPLISSILKCISQITGVIRTVIALSQGHAQNFVQGEDMLFFLLPPSHLPRSHAGDALNTQRAVTSEKHHSSLARAAQDEA